MDRFVHINKILIFIAFIFLLSSCDPMRVYEENQQINTESWNKNDIKEYHFNIEDTLLPYNLYVNIRNTTDYGFSNIYFFIQIDFVNGISVRDTVEFLLADQRGNWLGKGKGKIKDNQILYGQNVRFPSSGEYRITIEQAMREDNLPGISDVGVRIEKSKQ